MFEPTGYSCYRDADFIIEIQNSGLRQYKWKNEDKYIIELYKKTVLNETFDIHSEFKNVLFDVRFERIFYNNIAYITTRVNYTKLLGGRKNTMVKLINFQKSIENFINHSLSNSFPNYNYVEYI
jgi:hypothetical protein